MGLLSGDALQALFGSVFGAIYEDAMLEVWARSNVRDPLTGTFPYSRQSEHDVKVQRDDCTEVMRQADGYSVEDVRFLILQSGLPVQPDGDCRLVYRSQSYRLFAPIGQDPARAYFEARARLMKGDA